jgi:3-hydroxyisobutyrate dehydrogenase-like beta-hydroxyacid dehydrogenase
MKRIGFLGFGEVGSCFSKDLKTAGAEVMAYDKFWNVEPHGHHIRERSAESGVDLSPTPQALAAWADVLISVTAPAVALDTAQMIAESLRCDQIFADFNSATPQAKRDIARLVGVGGCDFVDGGILGSPRMSGHRVPIVVSGPRADQLASLLNEFGMHLACIGTEPGQAAALKVIRSVFTKGLEAVLLECLVAAEVFGIRDSILRSLVEFLGTHSATDLFNMLITTHAVHARRRAGEMEGVLGLLEMHNIDAIMTAATHRKLQWSADLRVGERLRETPMQLADVIKAVAELSQKSEGRPS